MNDNKWVNEWMEGWILNSNIKVGQQFYELKWVYETDDLSATNVIPTTKYSCDRTLLFKALVRVFLPAKVSFFCKKKKKRDL